MMLGGQGYMATDPAQALSFVEQRLSIIRDVTEH